jgi:transcriptional regulator with XRE-family HTH domain
MEHLTTTLTQLRLGRGWSKNQLAFRSRVDPSRLSKIESGRAAPYPVELRRLAKALGLKDTTGLLDTVAPADPGVNGALAEPPVGMADA